MHHMFPLFASLLLAAAPMPDFADNKQIAMQNAILVKVNDKTFSMLDVRKKMDLLFYQNYPQLSESTPARLQYYEVSWRQVLRELVDNELMLADAGVKEVALTDGEIREEMESRFGPNVMRTLEKIGLSYEETWALVKSEMIVRRMSWWFVHSRALSAVTPQDIRQAYRIYLKEHPPYQEWTYRVISVKDESIVQAVHEKLLATGELLAHEAVQASTDFTAKDQDLSEMHKKALASLEPGQYSSPIFQLSRSDKKGLHRIFHLIKKEDHPAPPFEALTDQLRGELVQKAIAAESTNYLERLRKQHGYDEVSLQQVIPTDLHPFSLQ